MRKFFALLLLIPAIFVLALTLWYTNVTKPINPSNSSKIEFTIKPGTSLDQIGKDLQEAGLIRSLPAFKLTVWRLNLAQKVQAGYVYLSPSQNLEGIIVGLTKSTAKQVWITIPEGLRRQEIAKILQTGFSKSADAKFDAQEFISQTQNKEGRLFPDTYAFKPDATASEVVARLTSHFDEVVLKLNITSSRLDSVVILASLLEREAANSSEMPEVAGVLTNRLNKKWPLQVDATVQYALASQTCRGLDCTWWPKSLTKADLKINSPYNTYQNQGLPPAPISNPGSDALAAAANPITTNNWFYIHDSDGKIHFAATAEAHAQNVCQYLKKDCQ